MQMIAVVSSLSTVEMQLFRVRNQKDFQTSINHSILAAHPVEWLMEGEKRWEAPEHPVLPQNWDGTEENRKVTYMVLKAKANDRRKKPIPSPR
ncbi:hypothetical protein TNCV_422471 [Trichonephila clavipes]|nr:hypothetical protein TNCV_422471 [Trichonephila clavipes]